MIAVVTHEEVISAVLAASGTLAGFGLVFLGLVMASSDFAPGTAQRIVMQARKPAVALMASFAIGIGSLGSAMAWMLSPRVGPYWMAVSLFLAQLVSLVAATAWVVRRTLWG